ncbi:MAG: tripartite tricarboxylate transporter substrate binding protein [Burkholderiales bacterium]|nr:tripartite tricarboxylate transporter substrate binding protein [Burkholderiales bacterium]
MLLALAYALPTAAFAQSAWPERPIRLIIPFGTGSASDTVARLVTDRLAPRLGRPIIVDNRPGANAIIGTDLVAKATPDGYTLLSGGNTTHAANPNMYKSLPFDPVRDFSPVAYICGLHYFLVVAPNHPARGVQDLVSYAKQNAGKLTYGAGNASATVAAELFKLATGTDFAQVNYKGNPLAAADVMTGAITMMFLDNSVARPFLQSKRLRALGIATGKRSESFSDVPTMAEVGFPAINFTAWIAWWYPAKTPKAIVDRVNAEVNAVRNLPEVAGKLLEIGFSLDDRGSTPPEFGEFVKKEIALWARVVAEAKIPKQ